MINKRWCRKQINNQVGRIKRMYRWATGGELVPGSVYHNIQPVEGLKRGRSEAVETEDVFPVPLEKVNVTLSYLSKIVADMVPLCFALRKFYLLALRALFLFWPINPNRTNRENHPNFKYQIVRIIEYLGIT